MLLTVVSSAICKTKNSSTMNYNEVNKTEKILFINGSPNRDGNTAALAKALHEKL